MQQQLEKITNLVRLIVQKMEIGTEIVIEDRSKYDNKEKYMKTQQLRQTLNIARRIHHLRPSNVSNTLGHTTNV